MDEKWEQVKFLKIKKKKNCWDKKFHRKKILLPNWARVRLPTASTKQALPDSSS
jgi:hypothetical protein